MDLFLRNKYCSLHICLFALRGSPQSTQGRWVNRVGYIFGVNPGKGSELFRGTIEEQFPGPKPPKYALAKRVRTGGAGKPTDKQASEI